jgi:D-amino peptidase
MATKVFISFDYEGIGGVASWTETEGDRRWNELATRQLVAYCEGIFSTDPQAEVVVADSHANGNNILWEQLPDRVSLIRGTPRNHYMFEGIDRSFTHLVLFGYHTAIGGGGMMDHTYSASAIYEIRINGKPVDEGLINAYAASEYGVPLAFVYGDDKTAEFYRAIPGIDTLACKKAISRFAGEMRPLGELLRLLTEKGQALPTTKGKVLNDPQRPIVCEMTMTDATRSYLCAVIPGVERPTERTLRFTAHDYLELYRYLITVVYICAMAKTIR